LQNTLLKISPCREPWENLDLAREPAAIRKRLGTTELAYFSIFTGNSGSPSAGAWTNQ